MIYVTHDQVEAMTLADRIVVCAPAGSSKSAPRSNSTTRRTTASSPASSARPHMNFLPASVFPRSPGTVGIRPQHLFRAGDGILGTVTLVEALGGEKVVRAAHRRPAG